MSCALRSECRLFCLSAAGTSAAVKCELRMNLAEKSHIQVYWIENTPTLLFVSMKFHTMKFLKLANWITADRRSWCNTVKGKIARRQLLKRQKRWKQSSAYALNWMRPLPLNDIARDRRWPGFLLFHIQVTSLENFYNWKYFLNFIWNSF